MRSMFRKIGANPQWFVVVCIVQAFMITAAYISAGDIMKLASKWGVYDHLLWTAPVFIDGLTWMGKFGRSTRFDPSTRKAGLYLMAFGGLMSLAANVAAGENAGMRAYGALVVIGFVAAEWYSTKLRPAASPAPADDTSSKPAARVWVITQAEKDARKRAGYNKMTPAEKIRWTRQYRERISRRMPTSGAGVGPTTGPVPSVQELESAVA